MEPRPDYPNLSDLLDEPKTFPEQTPAGEIIDYFAESKRDVVLLTEQTKNQLTGVITREDVARFLATLPVERKRPALDLGTRSNIVAVREDATVSQAREVLEGGNYWKLPFECLPVVNEDLKPVGMLSRRKLERVMDAFESRAAEAHKSSGYGSSGTLSY